MLAIRMQRTGRKGHALFRLIVQDAHRSPASGKIISQLGHYDPHSKKTVIDKEKASFYLEHGAQPSPRVVGLLKSEKIKLPNWVQAVDKKAGAIRNTEKLRRNRPPSTDEKSSPKESEVAVEEAQLDAKTAVTTEEAPSTEKAGPQNETDENTVEAGVEKPAEKIPDESPDEPAK